MLSYREQRNEYLRRPSPPSQKGHGSACLTTLRAILLASNICASIFGWICLIPSQVDVSKLMNNGTS